MSDTAVSADPDFDEDSEGEDLGVGPDSGPNSDPGSSSQAAAGAPQLLTVPPGTRADRLDKVLAGLMPEHSRSRLQGWIEAGKVLVNGGPAKVRQVVGPDDELTVWTQPAPETRAFAPEPVDFEVVDASPDWIVVNKPAGLVTHPAPATGAAPCSMACCTAIPSWPRWPAPASCTGWTRTRPD